MTTVEQLPEHWAAGCSNAKRWVNCPDSKNAVDDREPGKSALIGTLGHKIVEQLLRGETVRLDPYDQTLLDGMENDEKEDFVNSIILCFDFVRDLIYRMEDGDEIKFETKIVSTQIGNHGGTVDVIVYWGRRKRLHVIDFKFGKVPVESADNYQLGAYINLARQEYPDATTFNGTIIQPAYCGVSTSLYSVEWLDEWLLDAAVAADTDNHERVAGAEWCEWCPMLPTCKTAAKMGRQAGHDFEPIAKKTKEAEPLTAEDVLYLEKIVLVDKVVKKQLAAATILLKDAAKKGSKLDFHRITQTIRRNWKDDAEEFAATIASSKGIDEADLFERTLRTPAQLRDSLEFSQEDFDKTFALMLQCTTSPTLRAGTKPSATDLQEFEPVTS